MLHIQHLLSEYAQEVVADAPYEVRLLVNPAETGLRRYLLALGSCIECGEEGLVGRGNAISGVISASRQHCVEAPWGKNPVYHTGKVLGFLTQRLAKTIYQQFNVCCSVYALTKCDQALLPPHALVIQLEKTIDQVLLRPVIEEAFLSANYVEALIQQPLVLQRFYET